MMSRQSPDETRVRADGEDRENTEGESRLHTDQIAAGATRNTVERKPEDVAPSQQQAPLFVGGDAEQFRSRWTTVQTGFVDEPRKSVEQADALVAEVMQKLAQVFADERKRLEQQWDRGGQTDTEELRQALRRYRSFFDRLLAM